MCGRELSSTDGLLDHVCKSTIFVFSRVKSFFFIFLFMSLLQKSWLGGNLFWDFLSIMGSRSCDNNFI
ncbi:hypothetical protein [Sulfolobus sp. E11-6]|uniref:hypothetical protein n=1 Tax=Sulfolobus sp. E11-6 TaxID=2663020 RepID=UPI0039C978B2